MHSVDLAEEIDALVAGLEQGMVVEGLPMLVAVDPSRPASDIAKGTKGPGLTAGVVTPPLGLAITTQTCDLVRGCETRPYFTASPVVKLRDAPLSDATSGRSPRWAAVPARGPDCFVDLDINVTFDKAVLLGHPAVPGCVDQDDRSAFAKSLVRNSGRFPFPNDVQYSLKNLRAVFGKRANKNSAEGRAVDNLVEVRVQPHGRWDRVDLDITVMFVFREGWMVPVDDAPKGLMTAPSATPADVCAAIESEGALPSLVLQLVSFWAGDTPHGTVRSIAVDIYDEAELSVMHCRGSEVLDFDFLSVS